jgi:DNA replication protein DnaC
MHDMTADRFIVELLHQEMIGRSERSKTNRIRSAGLPYNKYISDYDPEMMPDGTRKHLGELKMHSNLLSIKNIFEKTDLLIPDELGYISFDREVGELLFTHLSMRSERKGTIITTNVSTDKWKTIFDSLVIAVLSYTL